MREALLEVREKANDSTVKVEAHSLAEELDHLDFRFVVWSGMAFSPKLMPQASSFNQPICSLMLQWASFRKTKKI